MPLSRQQLQVDQAGRENAAQPRLRAAAFDLRKPVAQQAAALKGCSVRLKRPPFGR
jgi:hypothetical protein